jgi:hypothetical protein
MGPNIFLSTALKDSDVFVTVVVVVVGGGGGGAAIPS